MNPGPLYRQVSIDTTKAALQRLGRVVVTLGVRVTSSYLPHRYALGRGVTAHVMLAMDPAKEQAVRDELKPWRWEPPTRVQVGMSRPPATYSELAHALTELMERPRATRLPCGHPLALLRYDGAKPGVYACLACLDQAAEDERRARQTSDTEFL